MVCPFPSVDALEVLGRSGSVRYTCAPSEVSDRDPLLLEDSFCAWMLTRGAFVPRVLPEPPEGDWSAFGLIDPDVRF